MLVAPRHGLTTALLPRKSEVLLQEAHAQNKAESTGLQTHTLKSPLTPPAPTAFPPETNLSTLNSSNSKITIFLPSVLKFQLSEPFLPEYQDLIYLQPFGALTSISTGFSSVVSELPPTFLTSPPATQPSPLAFSWGRYLLVQPLFPVQNRKINGKYSEPLAEN